MAASALSAASLKVIDPLADAAWDDKVRAHPDCCFFHGASWARVLRDSYGQHPAYFALQNGAGFSALLPVIEVKSILTGFRGVSLPFTDFCPPLGSDRSTYSALLQEVIAEGRRRGWRHLECRGGFEMLENVPSSMSFCAHTLDLTVGEEKILKRFEGRVRNAVRKAEAAGVKVEILQDLVSVKEFYRLHCETRRKHGVPPQPFRFFESIYREIVAKGQGIVVLAKLQGVAIAGAVFFNLGTRVIYKYSASDKMAQQVRPNNLLMWEAIRWYARAGAAEMHFGRSSISNEGLRLYKRGFGTTETPLHYFKFDLRRQQFVSGNEKPPGWANRVCSALPLPLLRLAGRVLYKHMS
jgi:hypothetical protein